MDQHSLYPRAPIIRKTENALGVVNVEEDPSIRVREGDLERPAIEWAVTDHKLGMIRDGYACVNCMEEFKEGGLPIAWPDNCPVCGYAVRENQRRDMQHEFTGYIRIGPTVSDQDEIEMLTERTERRIWTPGRSALFD